MNSFLYYDEEEKAHVGVWHDNGAICPYYCLKGKIFKHAAAYISIKADIHQCIHSLKCLMAFKDDPYFPQVAKSSLLFASVIKYARCFTEAEGRGTSLNSAHVFKDSRQIYLSFHKNIMELRNQYLAHAGENAPESRIMIALLNPDKNDKKRLTIMYAGMGLKDDDLNLHKYISLYQTAFEYADEKCEQLRPRINEEADKIDIEEMYAKCKTPEKNKFELFNNNHIHEF